MYQLKVVLLMVSLYSAVAAAAVAVADTKQQLDSHILPRPLILQHSQSLAAEAGISSGGREHGEDELQLRCTAWRFSVETNNAAPWKTIPHECAEYVRNYLSGKGYALDLDTVAREVAIYARSFQLSSDGNDAWVFDIDETSLSNLPYYAQHGFGLEVFDAQLFDEWVETAMAPAIVSSLKLYGEVLKLGFKVFFLTGRSDRHRAVTADNLKKAGFEKWEKLILR